MSFPAPFAVCEHSPVYFRTSAVELGLDFGSFAGYFGYGFVGWLVGKPSANNLKSGLFFHISDEILINSSGVKSIVIFNCFILLYAVLFHIYTAIYG